MASNRILLLLSLTVIVKAVTSDNPKSAEISENEIDNDNPSNIFKGVYSECFFQLSYTCLQRKTLLYLKELNKLKEISIIGDYVKFVKLNTSENDNDTLTSMNTEELAYLIDNSVDKFFENHLIRFTALGKDIMVPETVEEFVGRKRRKGGGGGGGHGGGGDDGGKKKMMMMAMMCMKMKFMMMVPAMMGMMGMMSFKGMMFSMMSFMLSKMMLLMKLLEKKGGGGGGGGWNAGGGDGGWAAGGGGGAWMPAGQDYGGGGYDANGQWQSRSIIETQDADMKTNKPIVTYVKPIIAYSNKVNEPKPMVIIKNLKDEVIKIDQIKEGNKSRRKRSIIDDLQRAYLYWTNKVFGIGYKKQPAYPKFRVINGVKYIYHPIRQTPKLKSPKELHNDDVKPVNISEFNKGEIVEPAESRMIKKKLSKMKENVNDTVDDNPWQ